MSGYLSRSPNTSGSPSNKQVSHIYVAKLIRLRNGRYKVESIPSAESRYESFMWKFFHELGQTTHNTTGVTRDTINDILIILYPDRRYRTYYSHIIKPVIAPRNLNI